MPVTNSGAEFTIVDRGERRCWLMPQSAPSNYFYLKVDSSFAPESGKTLEIDLAYFDSGSGDITLDYDSTDTRLPAAGAYKRYP